MAGQAETPFNSLLHADSDFNLPDNDPDVIAALMTYGVAFKKTKSAKLAEERLDLLSGLVWLHVHANDMSSAISAASDGQQRRLAAALRLDFVKDSASASWPALLSRKILANAMPGQTPQKRKAPDGRLDGQIQKPGGAPPPLDDDGAAKRTRRNSAGKGARAQAAASDASKSDSDASLSTAEEPVVVSDDDSATPAALMPPELGNGPAFAELVRTVCARRWVPPGAFETTLSAAQSRTLWRARLWSAKDRTAYEKMITKQASRKSRSSRREDPNLVACPHRLTFAWSGDDCVGLEAQHLAMVCSCENLSDWAGPAGRLLGGAIGRSAYQHVQSELHEAWSSLTAQVARSEHVGALCIKAVFDLLEVFLERRYKRYATVLPPGRLREEVLANVARQHDELHVYFESFNDSLSDRCRRQDYDDRARYAGERYLALLAPAVAALLNGDDGPGFAGPRSSSAGGATAVTPSPARRSILKSVAFEAVLPATPPAAPARPVADSPTPAPSPGAGWPTYAAGPPPYYYPGGGPLAYGGPGGPFQSPSQGAAAWSGYAGSPPGPAPPAAGPGQGHPSRAPAPAMKADPGAGAAAEKQYLSQPLHAYVSGVDCASVPVGQVRRPACGCLNNAKLSFVPGPHASWDCPLRYIDQCGYCPGFNLDGSRDPAQWQGANLTRAAKGAWLALIAEHKLTVAKCKDARPPPFHL
jgi:hypothetical protein